MRFFQKFKVKDDIQRNKIWGQKFRAVEATKRCFVGPYLACILSFEMFCKNVFFPFHLKLQLLLLLFESLKPHLAYNEFYLIFHL
jgi:hypothetical protein